jgi:thiamine biosynthesis lipoprotein ApbE
MGAERGLALAKKQGLRVLFLLRDGDGFTARATPDFPASR